MFWKNYFDKPGLIIEREDAKGNKKVWKSWSYGRLALELMTITALFEFIKLIVKWLF